MEEVLKCPFCGNHCPQNSLLCGRGKRYFGAQEHDGDRVHGGAHGGGHGVANGDEIVQLLRKCGHYLHHSGKEDTAVRSLTDEERKTLCRLLEKCYAEWQQNE